MAREDETLPMQERLAMAFIALSMAVPRLVRVTFNEMRVTGDSFKFAYSVHCLSKYVL